MSVFSADYIKEFVSNENARHPFYKKTVDISEHLKFHFDGVKNRIYNYEKDNAYFKILIEQRRPGESEPVKVYRKDNYKPITKIPCSKVTTSLQKISRSHGWKVDFSQVEKNTLIAEQDSPENYLTKKFPVSDSVENWYFEHALPEQLKDPNGLVLVVPFEHYLPYDDFKALPENERVNPIAIFIPSIAVIDYVAGKHAVILSNEKWEYLSDDGKTKLRGDVYWLIEKGSMSKVYAKQDKKYNYIENYGPLPVENLACFRIGGNLKDVYGITACYDSFVSPMVPYLDKAATEDNDLDAAVVLHLHPTMWYYTGQECNACRGIGYVKKAGTDVTEPCGECKGNGRLLHSPYTDIAVKPQEAGTQAIPTPPIGFADKPIDIIKIQSERTREHIQDALSSINMEFLYQEPLNISGKAKSIDRDELNNFVSLVAKSCAKNIERINETVIAERYPDIDEKAREKLEPVIMVPESFDFFTSSTLIEDMKALVEADADPAIVNAVEVDYITKKFAGRTQLRDKLIIAKEIDPFSGIPSVDKENMMLANLIKKEDYILSVYINSFVDQAVREKPGFLEMDRQKQKDILYSYVPSKMPKEVKPTVKTDPSGNPTGDN